MNDEQIRERYAAWEAKRMAAEELYSKYFKIGTGPVEMPERVVTPEALEEIGRMRAAEQEAYQAWIKALESL